MSLKESNIDLNMPLSKWPVFYKDGLPFIYDDEEFLYDEKGERLGEHSRHSNLAIYLRELLTWLYRGLVCTISFNLTFRAYLEVDEAAPADAGSERRRYIDVTPDVAVIKGIHPPDLATYVVGRNGPAPDVVIEVASPSTYQEDLGRKLRLYAEVVHAKEYFSYDPHLKRLWKGSRLKAWRMVQGEYVEIVPDERGWVWSEELESWLVEEGAHLWLYDRDGEKRFSPKEENEVLLARTEQAEVTTQALGARIEALATQTQAIVEQIQAVAEQQRLKAELAETRAELAEVKVEQERLRAEKAEVKAEREQLRAERLAARLLELDPNAELKLEEDD